MGHGSGGGRGQGVGGWLGGPNEARARGQWSTRTDGHLGSTLLHHADLSDSVFFWRNAKERWSVQTTRRQCDKNDIEKGIMRTRESCSRGRVRAVARKHLLAARGGPRSGGQEPGRTQLRAHTVCTAESCSSAGGRRRRRAPWRGTRPVRCAIMVGHIKIFHELTT